MTYAQRVIALAMVGLSLAIIWWAAVIWLFVRLAAWLRAV
jgi:ABC-type antimicrobial peptide transport system permease subunit